MIEPYIICTTPRTRSGWLATWLTYGKSYCTHELLQHCSSFSEMKEMFEDIGGVVGNSDMANSVFIDPIMATFPNAKVVLVTRPTAEWVDSTAKIDIETSMEMVELIETSISEVRKYSPLELILEDLDDYQKLAKLWWFLTGRLDVEARTRQMMTLNIQPHLPVSMPMWKKSAKNFNALMKEQSIFKSGDNHE